MTGQSPSTKFIDVVCSSVRDEKSDEIFELQFDNTLVAINRYTPSQFRKELRTRMFYLILELIPRVPEGQENRLIVLMQKLVDFAEGEIAVNILLSWKRGEYAPLANRVITIGQEWSVVEKVCSQKHISQ